MFFRMVYDDRLAQAAYLIGCQRTGEAIVIDPERDVDRYLRLAEKQNLRVVAVAETHIHADFVSGSREMAERVGAKVYVSDEGGPDWSYQWLDKKAGGGSYHHQKLKHGDRFKVGNIEFRVLHTPGHTPEHICFEVTDHGGGAAEPMGIVTGDFVFVGDLGRPDLLETAAGQAGASAPSAQRLCASAREFSRLPEYLQVWPGHGAGSACGKALGAVPQSTVGYEKRFNPGVRLAAEEGRAGEEKFVKFILADQPEPPLYFARMKRVNKEGPAVLGSVPAPESMAPASLAAIDARKDVVVDTRAWKQFCSGHLPGSIFAPVDNMFSAVVGSYTPEGAAVYLVIEEDKADEAVRELMRVGVDRVAGVIPPAALAAYATGGGAIGRCGDISVVAAKQRIGQPGVFVLDVRKATEFADGHLPGAVNAAHVRLPALIERVPRDQEVIVQCRSGARSARALSYLKRAGFERVVNLQGGFLAWEQAGGPVER
jgi:hydroxyacylglutathione hydrolase